MKILLVRTNWFKPVAVLISLMTWSKVSHAALLGNDLVLYDASETRGYVDFDSKEVKDKDGNKIKVPRTLYDLKNQKVIVYDVPMDDELGWKYALSQRKESYDWKGIWGWNPIFKSNDPKSVYCFELVLQTLLTQEFINGIKLTQDLVGDLRNKLYQKPIDSDDIFMLMERCNLKPIYDGKAKNYYEPLR
jgi:hypothetical protein